MTFALSPALEANTLATAFAADRRLRIRDVLPVDDAQSLTEAVARAPFRHVLSFGEKPISLSDAEVKAMPADQRQELSRRMVDAAGRGDGYQYNGIHLDRSEVPALQEFHAFLNSDAMLGFIRTVTGEPVQRADAQATRYFHGHYLTRHIDQMAGEDRRIAYVFSMTPEWHPDWGGLLQFFEKDGTPRDTWSPGYNVLSLFHTDHIHSVTYVAPYARAPRLSVTGWFYA